ncbi:hypothetical protein F0562_014817 [Nyssa sinensis]|uniref:Phospholipase D alpha 1 n=1 Tax=Nyssa sinensis TaxID=561372 RepID=A0A5J4ZTY0_9ASTE|nr:hypothetical protein F0562_014817 [Nyssa sinensis]
MENYNSSSSYPYDNSYGYPPYVPPPPNHPYPPLNSGPYPPPPYPSPYYPSSHSCPPTYQYPPSAPPATTHSDPLEYRYPPPSHSGPLPYPYQGYPVQPMIHPPPQPSLQHHSSFQYGSPQHHYQHSGSISYMEDQPNVPPRVNSFSGHHRQDSSASVGTGSITNHGDSNDNHPTYPSVYPPIEDLLTNVNLSGYHPSAPAAPNISDSPTKYQSLSGKYDNEATTIYGYPNNSVSSTSSWDTSFLGQTGSPHPALSHSTSFMDSPHSQNLQIVPSKGSLKVLLLHGNLDIWIHEAKDLPNMDMFHKTIGDVVNILPMGLSNKIEGHVTRNITSDPYVSISVTGAVIGRTYVISNNENPVWKQHFYVPVAHHAAEVRFLVKDSDVVGSQLIGTVAIPVEHIYSGAKVEGVFPILNNSGKPCKPGAVLSLSVQYTPIERLWIYHHGVGAGPDYYGVPDTYFPLRRGGTVTLYQDAHVPDGCLPNLKLDHGMQYVHGKCWHDIFEAIRQARRLIYITGWSVWHKVRLVRDASSASGCSLGDLLKSKSQEGVRVLLLVWDDPTSRNILGYKTDGIMQTHDEETRRFFKHSSVQVLLCPRVAGKRHSWLKQREVGMMYTHHQKTVIVDADAGNNRRRIIAFLGGLDLCNGRYDTPQHPILRTLQTVHIDDYHNPTYTGNAAGCPREPWHDLHCKIDGPAGL